MYLLSNGPTQTLVAPVSIVGLSGVQDFVLFLSALCVLLLMVVAIICWPEG